MAKAFSYDLRLRVIRAIEQGLPIIEASKVFNVSRKVIFDWKKLKRETGDVKARQRYRGGHSHCVTDLEAFKMFIENNSDKTAKELAALWPDPISRSTVLRLKKKLGYSYKKNFLSPQA